MPSQTQDLLQLLDAGRLDRRYWTTFTMVVLGTVLDYFDFFLVAYIVAIVGPAWHLDYGQSSAMVLGAGVGSMLGALVAGRLADSMGRRRLMAGSLVVSGICGGLTALVPEGAWWLFALLRCGVGFGLSGAAAVSLAMVVEFTPTRHRTVLASLSVMFSTIGNFIGSGVTAALLGTLGWRGLAALGVLPAALGACVWLFMPESVRWLMARNRLGEAREVAARVLGLPVEAIPQPPAAAQAAPARVGLRELYGNRRRFWMTLIVGLAFGTCNFGVYLWGPTITSLVLHIPVKAAAGYFAVVTFCGIVGKVIFTLLPGRIGRLRCLVICAFGSAVCIVVSALYFRSLLGGYPVFIVMLGIGALFFDGAFANIGPYTAELFPVRQAARGIGLFQAANGAGRIVGPLSLALIAGTGNYVTPAATESAVLPAFLLLGACGLAAGITLLALGIETRGRPLQLGTEEEAGIAPVASPSEGR